MASILALSVISPVVATADSADTLQGDAHLTINYQGAVKPTSGDIAMTGVPSFNFGTHRAGKMNDDGTFTIVDKIASGKSSGSALPAPAIDTSPILQVNDMRTVEYNAWSIIAEVNNLYTGPTNNPTSTVPLTSFKLTVADGDTSPYPYPNHVKGTGSSGVDIHGAASKIASHDDTIKHVYNYASGDVSAEMTLPANIAVGDYHAVITYSLLDVQ